MKIKQAPKIVISPMRRLSLIRPCFFKRTVFFKILLSLSSILELNSDLLKKNFIFIFSNSTRFIILTPITIFII